MAKQHLTHVFVSISRIEKGDLWEEMKIAKINWNNSYLTIRNDITLYKINAFTCLSHKPLCRATYVTSTFILNNYKLSFEQNDKKIPKTSNSKVILSKKCIIHILTLFAHSMK
jgi:hypothetical protein